jgi:hypothetical protein
MLAPDDRMDGREGAPVGPAEFGRGELAPRDAAEFRGLKRMIQAHAGLCCDGYKERVLRRRIAVRMRAKNVQTFGAYAALLKRDPSEYQRLVSVYRYKEGEVLFKAGVKTGHSPAVERSVKEPVTGKSSFNDATVAFWIGDEIYRQKRGSALIYR